MNLWEYQTKKKEHTIPQIDIDTKIHLRECGRYTDHLGFIGVILCLRSNHNISFPLVGTWLLVVCSGVLAPDHFFYQK